MERDIRLLDCTLRDGAHLNKGYFGRRTIEQTIVDLVDAKVDIIEVGFFDNDIHDADHSYFSSIAEVKEMLPKERGNSKFSLMADCVDVNHVEPCDTIQRRGADLMINQMNQNENTQNQFSNAIKELQLGKLLRKSNITKSCGISAYMK